MRKCPHCKNDSVIADGYCSVCRQCTLPPADPGSGESRQPGDTEILDWLDAHPLPAQIRGGPDDGHTAKFWGISAYDGTLREAVTRMILTSSTRKKHITGGS